MCCGKESERPPLLRKDRAWREAFLDKSNNKPSVKLSPINLLSFLPSLPLGYNIILVWDYYCTACLTCVIRVRPTDDRFQREEGGARADAADKRERAKLTRCTTKIRCCLLGES